MKCKWLEGSCLADYNVNAMKWKEHTSTTEFENNFATILEEHEADNDKRAARVEEFFIEEA
jgi:hypothetical protein